MENLVQIRLLNSKFLISNLIIIIRVKFPTFIILFGESLGKLINSQTIIFKKNVPS
ncbi:hypothetical protein pb186bvf_000924 [Paramecium bursaria]